MTPRTKPTKQTRQADTVTVTIEDVVANRSPEEIVFLFGGTKSAAIRGLAKEGLKVKEIASRLNIRYQHVRNVLTRPLKRGPHAPREGTPAAELEKGNKK